MTNIQNIKINWQKNITGANQTVIPVNMDFIVQDILKPEATVKSRIEKIRKAHNSKDTIDNQNIIKTEKLKLPAFLCGQYDQNKRSKEAFLSTNAMIFDFDELDMQVDIAKQKLNSIPNFKPILIFASPRGDRLKAMYVVQDIYDIDTYSSTYAYYVRKLQELGFIADTTSKDGRQEPNKACFTSHDENLVYNKDNYTVLEIVAPKNKETKKPIVKQTNYYKYLDTTDELQEARRVLSFIQGRPSYFDWLTVYSACCNKWGLDIGKQLCQEFMPSSANEMDEYDRKAKHLLKRVGWGSVVRMAKSNGYEPPRKNKDKKIKTISNGEVYTTKPTEVIEIVEAPKTTEQIKQIDILKQFPQFWTNGEKPVIDYNNLLTFLEYVGFRSDKNKNAYYRVLDNIIEMYNTEDDVEKEFMRIIDPINNEDMIRAVRTPHLGFIKAQLNKLKQIEIKEHRDTKRATYFYFTNGVLEITSNNTKLLQYKDIKGHVFSDRIIDFVFDLRYIDEYTDSDFYKFMCNVAMQGIDNPDTERLNSLMANIGYMISRYKNSDTATAICLQEENFSHTADGGTGKGLITKAIGKVRNLVTVDGKNDMDYRFIYENVNERTDIVCINDVKADYDFTKNYNMVTDELEVARKNKKPLVLPFEIAPKFLFSTNYRIRTEGSSSKRRMTKYTLSHYYGYERRPSHDFGKEFFSQDWDREDWQKFYSLMAMCSQLYLNIGKAIAYETDNEAYSSLRYTLKYPDLLDFIDYQFEINNGVVHEAVCDLYNNFVQNYSINQYKYEQKDFERDMQSVIKIMRYETKEVPKKRSAIKQYPYKAVYFTKKSNAN
jgi:hypothetical protein